MVSFLEHHAEREGLIEIRESLDKRKDSKTKGLEAVDHVIIDPHGTLGDVPLVEGLEEYLRDHDSEQYRRYLAVERDLGMPEFRDELLANIPKSLAISFGINRGFTDPNRTPQHALRKIVSNAPEDVRRQLMDQHRRALRAVDEIIGKLKGKKDLRISLIHSTEPYDDADPTVNDLDLSVKENLDRYVQVRTNVGEGHGPIIPVCFITGKGDGPTRDDELFRRLFQKRLRAEGIAFSEDKPYATHQGIHKTSDYMRLFPGQVNAVDIPRDDLAYGEIHEGTFSLTDSNADPRKVAKMAEYFSESLRECMKRARVIG